MKDLQKGIISSIVFISIVAIITIITIGYTESKYITPDIIPMNDSDSLFLEEIMVDSEIKTNKPFSLP